MSEYFNERQIEILKFLREKADEVNKLLIDRTLNGTLPKSDIETVCHIINDEFLMEGIGEDYEPNEYGLELENLLDVVNRPRLK